MARADVAAPAEEVRRALAPAEALLRAQASRPATSGRWDELAHRRLNLLRLGSDFTVTEPLHLLDELSLLAQQCRSAVAV